MKHIIAYGTLRKTSRRGYNFNRFGGQEYIKAITLVGFDMFDLGYYPAVCHGEGIVKAELHSITDEAFKRVQLMELGAGYIEEEITIDDVDAFIYVARPERLAGFKQIETGDWN